ncbi:hypothetical protein L6164_005327 [Bauhinia variegata]|uniref:Uncharacterized protein n=1 Tax=Bauhinia variegata TaxID=167791 RepID=A0ACB9PQ00_BAUVA|nr:hypothetical protein L6164_005327 [Bauhinia variegata]
MESDDRARGWGSEIRVETRREGGGGSWWLGRGRRNGQGSQPQTTSLMEGRSRGVAVLWRKEFNCQITYFSRNYIDVEVQDVNIGRWRITGFYGFPDRSQRRDSWNLLKNLHSMSNLPWDAVTDCNLIDVPFKGYSYTWSRSRGTDNAVKERLDRALASSLWLDLFQNASLHNLVAPISDHNPIGLEDVVHGGWNLEHNEDLSSKLKNCAEDLDWWGHDLRTKFRHEVDSLKKEMERLRVLDDLDSMTLFNSRKDHLVALLVQEDQY